MLLTTAELLQLVDDGVITNVAPNAVKGTSIDVRLHPTLLLERKPNWFEPKGIVPKQTKMAFTIKDLTHSRHQMHPHQFLLGALMESVNLPNTLTAKFYLDSTPARAGLQHSAAISLKPDWKGRLTLELTNASQWHWIELWEEMPIGYIEIVRHAEAKSYDGHFQDQSVVGG